MINSIVCIELNKSLYLRKDRQGIYSQLQGNEIKPGDKIITGGQQNISNGSLVEWIEKDIVGGSEPLKD